MNYDGWVVIGTDVDSKEFDKEIKKLEKESVKFAKEEEQLLNKKAKLEVDISKSEKELDKLDKKIEEIQKKTKNQSKPIDIKISEIKQKVIPENLSSNTEYQNLMNQKEQLNLKAQSQIDNIISKEEEQVEKLNLQKSSLNDINQKLVENASNQNEVNTKLEEAKAKSMGLHLNFDNIGKSLMDNVKKVGKWAMAVFSLRGAYSAIRQATSLVSQYNDGINNKLYSMKMLFATALEPLITKIVNLFWKMMSYINFIYKAWFGVDLFAKASANSMKASAKSAKDIKKSLAGFDEANVLTDSGSTSGVSGASSPTFEMPENVEIPSWIKWIAENKDLILGFLKKLGIAIVGLKLAKIILQIGSIGKGLSTVFGFLKNMSGLQIFGMIAGVVLTLTGIVTTVKGIIAFIKDPSWSNFNKILEGLTTTLLGVGIAMVAFNATNPVGWIVLAVGALTGLVTIVSSFTEKLFKSKNTISDTKTAQEELTQAQKEAKEATNNLNTAIDNYENAVKRAEETEKKLKEAQQQTGISIDELLAKMEKEDLSYFDLNDKQKKVYKAYLDNKAAQENVQTSTENLTNAEKDHTEAEQKEIDKQAKLRISNIDTSESYDEYKQAVIDAYQKGEISAEEARDYIEQAMADMSDASRQTFQEDLPNDIKNGLDPSKYESTWDKFARKFNDVWKGIKETVRSTLDWINEKLGVKTSGNWSAANSFSNANVKNRFNAKGAIVYPKLQYHASGGIINQPGRGVPITQHIGGERGAEGVLPLTDSQQMDLLGQAIARHMTINLTNVTQMNGRILSRELKTMEAQQDFATNR